MGTCPCVMICVRKHRGMYVIWIVQERIKYIKVYNIVGITVLGSSVGFFIFGFSREEVTIWEDKIIFGMAP